MKKPLKEGVGLSASGSRGAPRSMLVGAALKEEGSCTLRSSQHRLTQEEGEQPGELLVHRAEPRRKAELVMASAWSWKNKGEGSDDGRLKDEERLRNSTRVKQLYTSKETEQ